MHAHAIIQEGAVRLLDNFTKRIKVFKSYENA